MLSAEELRQIRHANLAEYFRLRGYKTERRGNEYHIRSFGGLYISPEKGVWNCFSSGKGGHGAIDCLIEILGFDFKTAVRELTDGRVYCGEKNPAASDKPHQSVFKTPLFADNTNRVFEYLCGVRGLLPGIAARLIGEKLPYQDKFGNCVFPHYDEYGKMCGAELQGTSVATRFKGIAKGTRATVFQMDAGKPSKVFIFESAIDLLSFYQMSNPNDSAIPQHLRVRSVCMSFQGCCVRAFLPLRADLCRC